MAGRGRGGSSKFKASDAMGLSEEDFRNVQAACSDLLTEIYPPLVNKSLPISENEKSKYCLAIRQEFRDLWRSSPYHIQRDAVKYDNIVRYKDQFANAEAQSSDGWKPDPNCFPMELQGVSKKKARANKSKSRKKMKFTKDVDFKILDNLEMKEGDDDKSNSEEDSDDEDDVNEPKDEDGIEEVEFEEGADYAMSYFDNGEDYLDNEEEDEGPIY